MTTELADASTSPANAIDVRTAYQYDAFGDWRDLHEELGYLDRSGSSYLGRDRTVIEADVVALARSIVEGHSCTARRRRRPIWRSRAPAIDS